MRKYAVRLVALACALLVMGSGFASRGGNCLAPLCDEDAVVLSQ